MQRYISKDALLYYPIVLQPNSSTVAAYILLKGQVLRQKQFTKFFCIYFSNEIRDGRRHGRRERGTVKSSQKVVLLSGL